MLRRLLQWMNDITAQAYTEERPSQEPERNEHGEPSPAESKPLAPQQATAPAAFGLQQFGTRWSAFIGILMGFTAVSLTVYQAWATQRHERLMVRPYVRAVWYLEGAGHRNVLHLENSGLGPAIVRSLTVQVDGQSLDLLADGMHGKFVKILGARIKEIPGGEICFNKMQPEPGFVIRTDKPEPLLLSTSAALIDDQCSFLFDLALASGPIEFNGRYDSFAEDHYDLHQVVKIDMPFLYHGTKRQ